LIICFILIGLIAGCGNRTAELEQEISRLRAENEALRRELDKQTKRVNELLASYDSLLPKVDEIEEQIDATRRTLSNLSALSGQQMNERLRAELKTLIREVVEEREEARRLEQQEWGLDLRERYFDELAAEARLTPQQKDKIKLYMKQEREQVRAAYISYAAGLSTAEEVRRVVNEAKAQKEQKIKALLDEDQYKKYQEWARQRDIFRAGINRRQQAPNANEDDL